MNTQNWLPLNEYSAKYRVSISTLRRRIRANTIQHKLEDGKYWLVDDLNNQNLSNHISQSPAAISTEIAENVKTIHSSSMNTNAQHQASGEENLLESTQKLLQEIKSAYISVLHEKEAQIMALKDELADLKTLVRTLEYENSRLKTTKPTTESALLDGWIDSNF